jgi:MFS family permease
LVLTLACASQFMVILDSSIVNVALPSVQRDLGFMATGLAWVVNGYLLTFAGFMLLGGRAADLFGRRRMLVAGLLLFSASSLVGGLATVPGVLVAARVAQGMGAAMLAPATLAGTRTGRRESLDLTGAVT